MDVPWWKTAVTYQIYPRSFCDTGCGRDQSAEGVGDLEGVIRHLDHLLWLGVDVIWLSPFFPSPMNDFGYDVSDYCGVDPLFGDLGTFDRLVAESHRRGIRVVIDWVPNHTSIDHPWFAASRSSRQDPKRDWYVWRDPAPGGGPPNNWIESLTMGPAWTLDAATGQYYLHCFLPTQPDLNWSNAELVAAMHDTLRFWLERGVDGFRMDVVHLIGKDPDLPDDPEVVAGLPHVVLNDRPETHAHLRSIRRLLDESGERVSIGEVYLLDPAQVVEYYGRDDELHLCFNFAPLHARWNATAWRHQIEQSEAALGPVAAWPTWVLSNHDNPRHRTRYGGSEARARAAAVLLLTLRGAPFLYAGEELGLLDAEIGDDQHRDPGGRDGCRAPIPWDGTPTHGWTDATPWLPWPPEAERRNVANLREDPTSILHLYRDAIALRRATPSLQLGDLSLVDSPDGVVAYRRTLGLDSVVIAVNFTDSTVDLLGYPNLFDGRLMLSSIHPTAERALTHLDADEAAIIAPFEVAP